MVHDSRTVLFDSNSEGIMVTAKIGKHTVKMFDAIDELPIVRFHRYQKMLLIDAGVGSDIEAFDQRIEKVRRYLMAGKPDKAGQELDNLRQTVFMIQNEISPRNLAFAVLVAEVDGQRCEDLSEDGLRKTLARLQDATQKEMTARLDAVKKKIDSELLLYFPAIFNGSEVKEYYDLLRKRTLAVLNNIIAGIDGDPGKTAEVEKITTALLTYSNPKLFSGSDSVEIQHDRNFENLCLALSEQLHVRPKEYTVMEFYNAFDFLRERQREAEKAQKRP